MTPVDELRLQLITGMQDNLGSGDIVVVTKQFLLDVLDLLEFTDEERVLIEALKAFEGI